VVFRRFIRREIGPDGNSSLDASAVVGTECFAEWRMNRVGQPDMERNFQRCLTAHLTKSDGRKPFDPDEEEAVLKVVRHRRTWPAFQGTRHHIGQKGFRVLGFHERNNLEHSQSCSQAIGESGPSRQMTPSNSEECLQPLRHFGLQAQDSTGEHVGPQPETCIGVQQDFTLHKVDSEFWADDSDFASCIDAQVLTQRPPSPIPELWLSLCGEEPGELF
jgi:hypothetical protein